MSDWRDEILLTKLECARALRLDVDVNGDARKEKQALDSVDRLIWGGALTSIVVGRVERVPRMEVDRYIERQLAERGGEQKKGASD